MRNSLDAAPASAPPHEASVVRYYTTPLLLRVLASDAFDPQGASFAPLDAAHAAPFLHLSASHLVPPLFLRAPSLVVVPLESTTEKSDAVTRGVFTVLPAEGFVKQPGEPVYYNEPLQLMDQHGRVLGVVTRAPYAGHVAADGHSGAVVVVFEKHTSRLQAIGHKFLRHEIRRSVSSSSTALASEDSESSSSDGRGMPRSGARRTELVQVCGGERLRIAGLQRVVKKQYPGGCIMQPKLEDAGRSNGRRSSIEEATPYLTCEVVLTSTPSPLVRSESNSSTSSVSSAKKHNQQLADRTATGEFVGVLHSGILHRRSDHMKLWKKRFFVLTQVALHRFDVTETLDTVRTQKARGSIYLKDCTGVRYERFSRPHELDIELTNGKVFSLHSVDALTCSEWASVLSRAIENPQWVHAERGCLTVWRSDYQFESPQCPAVTKVSLRRDQSKMLGCIEHRLLTISTSPQWNEKLSLGNITASGFVLVQLADGNAFRLTLEDLTRSLVQPRWIAVSTSLEVARIQALENDPADIPGNVSKEMPFRKSDSAVEDKADKSKFFVQLKFQADLQLDQRLTQRTSYESERKIFVGVVSGMVMLAAIAYGYRHSLNAFARSMCVVSATILVIGLIAFAPIAWHMYLWFRYGHSMEGELHWFLMLYALEVRPHNDEMAERMSTSSGEDARPRIESFIHGDEDEDNEDGAIVVPTKTPLYGLEASLLKGQTLSASTQAIRTFRLENALDSILARPLLSYFAIKEFFPSKFLPRDDQGRRVLLISLNKVNRHGLAAHNLSGFNVARYFLYLWEFIWSYQDMQEAVSQSQLVLIIDCSGWPYFKWFSIECQIMMHLLNTTNCYYPNRLAQVIFVRNQATFGVYGKLLRKGLDPGLRNIVQSIDSLDSFAKNVLTAPSSDETSLHDFVTNVLATHGNIKIPSFTRRELEQAARFTTAGSLIDDDSSASEDTIGTRAVVVPASVDTFTWQPVLEDDGFTMWKSNDSNMPASVNGRTFQSDARAAQWRGRLSMKTTNADRVIKLLQDPESINMWMDDTDKIVLLDKLSRQEDICFWSRRVPFMTFSMSGHRGAGNGLSQDARPNAFFHCVMRRIQSVKKGRGPRDSVTTVMWKTTSAQNFVLDRSIDLDENQGQVLWRKLEDPFVSVCFVVEAQATSGSRVNNVTLSFWFQSFSPPTSHKQDVEIAKIFSRRLKALDSAAG